MKVRHIQLGLVFFALMFAQSWGTYSRVESMGKSSRYIMDDISIFDNPANMNIYPNYLIGEFGSFTEDLAAGNNYDPQNPWFGGIFSLSLGTEESRDPWVSIGGALNRKDELLFSLIPDSVRWVDGNNVLQSTPVPETVTNFDGFLGGTTPSGHMFGSHIYIAHQQGAEQKGSSYSINPNSFASIVRFDLGANIGLSPDVDMEISGGLARVQFGPADQDLFDGDFFSVFGSGRLFSTIEMINGELVPTASFYNLKTTGIEAANKQLGIGVNVALDRGFFWLGVDGFSKETRTHHWNVNNDGSSYFFDAGPSAEKNWEVMQETGGIIGFGIERNIWWEWFVIRVGGQKVLSYRECNANQDNIAVNAAGTDYQVSAYCNVDGNYFYTNPIGDKTMGDHVGFGIGVNVEEKLKVDATMAEDVLFRNPFQGSGRLFSRISATYSF